MIIINPLNNSNRQINRLTYSDVNDEENAVFLVSSIFKLILCFSFNFAIFVTTSRMIIYFIQNNFVTVYARRGLKSSFKLPVAYRIGFSFLFLFRVTICPKFIRITVSLIFAFVFLVCFSLPLNKTLM